MKPASTGKGPDGLSRRELFALAGPGLFLGFGVDWLGAQEPARLPARQGYPTDLNAYLRIAPDGRVTCFSGKVELGQGATTVLAQILAEELDVAYDSVDMVLGDTELCPYDMGTFGSMNVRFFGPALRGAGAEARAILVQMAGEQLQAPAARLQVKAGVVTDPNEPGKSVTYGQLVQGKRIERHMEGVAGKPVAAYTVAGHAAARKDALDKVTGKAMYAGDFAFPGMLHALLGRPPAHGAKFLAADTGAAEKVGARVVREGELIAVLHQRPDLADKALGLVKARFERPAPTMDDKTIFDHLLKTAPPLKDAGASGDLAEGEKAAASTVEETYLNSYVAHAPLETHSATATVENGRATVWASTQAPFMVRQQVAQAIGHHQHLRARIAHGHAGCQSRRGPAGIPLASPLRRPHAPRAGGGGQAVRLEGRQVAQRARRRGGVRHLLQCLRRHHGGGGGRPQDGPRAGEAGGERRGRGPGDQSRRPAPADGRVHRHGARLRADGAKALQRRRSAGPHLRQLPDPALFLDAQSGDHHY